MNSWRKRWYTNLSYSDIFSPFSFDIDVIGKKEPNYRTPDASQVHDGLTLQGVSNVLKQLHLTKESVFVHVGCGTGVLTQLVAHQYGCTTWGVDVHKDMVDVARAAALNLGLHKWCRYFCGGVPSHTWLEDKKATHVWCYDFRLSKESWLYYKREITEWSKAPVVHVPCKIRVLQPKTLRRSEVSEPANQDGNEDENERARNKENGSKKGYSAVSSGAPKGIQPFVESDGVKQLERRLVSCFDHKEWMPIFRMGGRHAEPYNDGIGRDLITNILIPLLP